ncbi:hypothetical protein PCE1_000583 [Barthelona sp. PCE]
MTSDNLPLLTNKTHGYDKNDPAATFEPFFHYNEDMSAWEFFKHSIMAWTLFPIRYVVGWLSVFLCLLFTAIFAIGRDNEHGTVSTRRYGIFRFIGRIFTRFQLLTYGFYWLNVEGEQHVGPNGEKYGIVANHVSWVDILVVSTTAFPAYVAKSAIRDTPGVGLLAKMWGCYFLDRDDPLARQHLIENIQQRASDPTLPPIAIFPEGTTTRAQFMMNFKKGAFTAGTPVQPMLLLYTGNNNSVAWDTNSLFNAMFRVGTQFYNKVTIKYLPVYYPNDAEKADAVLYANNVRKYMEKSSGGKLQSVDLRYRHKKIFEDYLSSKIEWGELLDKMDHPDYTIEKSPLF